MANIDGWILRYMPKINKGRVSLNINGRTTDHNLDAADVAAVGVILGPGDGPAKAFTDSETGEAAIGRAGGTLSTP